MITIREEHTQSFKTGMSNLGAAIDSFADCVFPYGKNGALLGVLMTIKKELELSIREADFDVSRSKGDA